jgi:predicted CoA-binding protein
MKELKEKIIAVIGVSGREEKFGFKIFRDLIKAGFNVKGINPANGEVLGRKIYRNLKELENAPDLVITVVPGQVTERIVQECKELGIKEIWMQPGSESENAVRKAKEYGMSVTYNACFMVEHGIW